MWRPIQAPSGQVTGAVSLRHITGYTTKDKLCGAPHNLSSVIYGFQAFALGWFPPYTPRWLANPAYWWGFAFMSHGDLLRGRRASLMAVAFATIPMGVLGWLGKSDKPVQAAYYVWVVRMVTLCLGSWVASASGTPASSRGVQGQEPPNRPPQPTGPA